MTSTSLPRWLARFGQVSPRIGGRSRHTARRSPFRRPVVEALEDRVVLSPYLVTTTADTGPGSLRDAITQVNADTSHILYASPSNPNADEIDFNITAASDTGGGFNASTGLATIMPLSDLPAVSNPVLFNGYSQTGASPNTLANDDNAALCIVLDGGLDSNGSAQLGNVRGGGVVGNGLLTLAASNCTVEGLVINDFLRGSAITIMGGSGDHIEGNFLGINADGITTPLPERPTDLAGTLSTMRSGVEIDNPAYGNWVGASPSDADGLAARNVISSCSVGILCQRSDDNVIAGNFIGTDRHGTGLVRDLSGNVASNRTGIVAVLNESGDLIGGTTGDVSQDPTQRNVISGNGFGVILGEAGGGPIGLVLAGNYIGVGATGTALGNLGAGVAAIHDARDCTIGGSSAALGNIIANNGAAINGPGVGVSNYDGGPAGASPPVGITIEGNSIHDNYGLGIDLINKPTLPLGDGVTLNGSQTGVGPNNWQYDPVLSTAVSSGSDTAVTGTFSDPNEPSQTVTLDFYANASAAHQQTNGNYYGEGQTWLGSATVTTDPSGNASFDVDLPGNTVGQWISATATDGATATSPGGDTSEFSADVQVGSGTFADQLQASLPANGPSGTVLTVGATPATIDTVVAALSPSNLGQQLPSDSVYLNLAPGTYQQQTVAIPDGLTLYINGTQGTTIDPDGPAFTLTSGNVVVSNVTFTTIGDASTILVTGGSLTLRNDIIQESPNFTDAAISVTGGTVDLGTASDPGGNTIAVNGTGTFIRNTTANPVSAVGDTFTIDGQAMAWPIPLAVTANSSLALVGNSPPPLTGFVNGTPFTGTVNYTTSFGDTVTVTFGTAATSASGVGQYPIIASLSGADAGNYVLNQTAGTLYVVSMGPDPSSTTGAQAVTFWDNKGNARLITAADLSSLDALNLVTQGGSAFDPHSVAQLDAWLSVSPNATAAYQLAVQLAVMDLNVLAGDVHATDLVYAGGLLPYATADNIAGLTSTGFIDVQALMQAANQALALVQPGTPASDPNAAYEQALVAVLQAANGNTDFVTQELAWSLLALYPSLVPAA